MRLDLKASQEHRNRAHVRTDNVLASLKSMTPEQAAAWVESNVSNPASMKALLKSLAKAVTLLLHELDKRNEL